MKTIDFARGGSTFHAYRVTEDKLIFQVFAKENCDLCKKAQDVLSRAGVAPEVRYVEGTAATPENLADFAWYDWTDTPPLVVATDGEKIVGRWVAADIKDAWLPQVRRWLDEHQPA